MAGEDSCGAAWIVAGPSSLQKIVQNMDGLKDRHPGKSLADLLCHVRDKSRGRIEWKTIQGA